MILDMTNRRSTQYNKITTPELIEKINPENKRLVDDFLMYLRSIERSEGTIKSYKNDLDIFFVWNLQNNKNKYFPELSKRDIISYQNWLLTENKNSPARIRRLKSTLSSLSNYIENLLDDEIENFRGIIRKVENPPKRTVREKSVFTEEEMQTLLDSLVEKKEYQKACFVSLAMNCGNRKSELLRFKVDFFDDEHIIFGALYKTPEKIQTKGRGKGKFLHRYVLLKPFKPYLDLWLNQRKELGIESEWLFVKDMENGEYTQLPITTIDSWAKTFSRHFDKRWYPHAMRHFFTTGLKKANIPDSVIQEIIGWESAEMIKIYSDISADEQIGAFFDENGIKEVEKGSLEKL